VIFDPVKIDAAITGDIRKTIDIFFSIQPHLHDDGLDGLLDPVPANLRDDFRAAFGFVFDDPIGGAFLIKQRTQLLMDIAHKIVDFMALHSDNYTEKVKEEQNNVGMKGFIPTLT
jgi:hypothetical protein